MWLCCAFLAISIFTKAEGWTGDNNQAIFPLPAVGDTHQSHGGNSYPSSHGDDSHQSSYGGNSYPPSGGNSYPPSHGGNSHPPSHGGSYPGSFSYPYGCSHHCEYKASWEYKLYDDSIDFTVTAKVGYGYWAGIGFSYADKLMPESDCYTGHVSNHHNVQKFIFQDRYLFARASQSVPLDSHQDGQVKSHYFSDGYLTFTFNRKRYTGDHSDISLKNCVYVLHAWGGQALGAHAISKHTHKAVSPGKICFGPSSPPIHHPPPIYHPPPKPTYHHPPPKPTYYHPPYPKPTYYPPYPKTTYHPPYPKPTYYPPYPKTTYHPPYPKPTYYPPYPKPTYYPPYSKPTYHPPYPPVPFPLPPIGGGLGCYFKKCKPYEKCHTLYGIAFCKKCKDHKGHLGGGGGGKCGGGGGGGPRGPCRHYKGCGKHGTCYAIRGKPRCRCDPGYRQKPVGEGICKPKRRPQRPTLFAAGR